MGTNPLAWAAPGPDGAVVLDFATSKVAEGKLRIALADGRTVAPGCIIDREGNASVDPADFYAGGAMLPFGDHKGSGMSTLIELTAGLVSNMGASCDPEYQNGNGTLIIALDIGGVYRPSAVLRAGGDLRQAGEAHWRWSRPRRRPAPW
jgi:LDH2 family malate/lactate/ureidoglycolate dehydrogenase